MDIQHARPPLEISPPVPLVSMWHVEVVGGDAVLP
jgi:hypothetical protein